DPEITYPDAKGARDDVIVATGRSDYPNQVNNVLGFPYIFRGALDVRATSINDDMKIAAAHALAELARQDVPDEVAEAYGNTNLRYGPEYIIPAPFDPRLMTQVPAAVAKAAIRTGVARREIEDEAAYALELRRRLDPTAGTLQLIFDQVRAENKRVVFTEGEEERVIRAAVSFHESGYGSPILIGRETQIYETMEKIGFERPDGVEILNARLSQERNDRYTDFLYHRLRRRGFLYRDCQRLVNQDRNTYSSCMVAVGDADALVTGVTRSYTACYDDVRRVIDAQPGRRVFGLSMVLARGRTVFVADTTVHELPSSVEMADIAVQTAEVARRLGHEPRVAMLSFSNFGNPMWSTAERVREAVALLDSRVTDFEYDGEMSADVALNPELSDLYPFNRLSGSANVLIMPALHSANISSKLLQELGRGTVIGPILVGLSKPVQIAAMGASVGDLVNMAALAAHEAARR
ncbi:MAG: phosphate acyltransferase, partial [Alphaproteobacteria bacterium]|nr:phosphate acyltransferase [Alphaproteobacteria bacterium]